MSPSFLEWKTGTINPAEIYEVENPLVNGLWDRKYLLYLHKVTAVFDGFKALDIDDFGIGYNELRVVIGPNGAGKSTMCDVITGKTSAASGNIFFDKNEITGLRDVTINQMGIGRKFQTPTVFDSLTVFENLEMALTGNKTPFSSLWHRRNSADEDRIMSILKRVHLDEYRDRESSLLSHGQRQWLAISSLIVSAPKLLLVDEPAAGLTDSETALTAELLLELKNEHTIMVIEHDMDFVRQLNTRVSVLNEGRLIAEGSLDMIKNDPTVIEAYLGR